MKRHSLYCFVLLILTIIPVIAKPLKPSNGTQNLHRAQEALNAVIIHDIFSPPVASRIYVYSHMAAYEILIQQNQIYKSLHGKIKIFPRVPPPSVKIDY